ncbi:MAG: arginine N-succinyltransferase [Phycisphaerales bacterium]|nr:arginine N-succinyltransferase [Phycisphaerales bacterium]
MDDADRKPNTRSGDRMFIIRRAKIEDMGTLLKLAKMVHFINLPADKDVISTKILHSRSCFARVAAAGAEPLAVRGPSHGSRAASNGMPGPHAGGQQSDFFMFTLADAETGSVLGTSQIIARMGGPGNPNVSFKLHSKEFFSQSLQIGMKHTVAKLYLDESGPTEVGGLILQPSMRGHKQKLGRLISLIRFHFIGLHRRFFSDRVLAEMVAPVTSDGQNLLWEYLGRRFINLSYIEADRFCSTSREFMTALLPHEEIYLSVLPPEARAYVGQVGPETAPARRMLEKLGFKYRDFIDPFDGGPHLDANTDDISMVKQSRYITLGDAAAPSVCKERGYVSVLDADGEFRAIETEYAVAGPEEIRLPRPAMEALAVSAGATLGLTPISAVEGRAEPRRSGRGKAGGGKARVGGKRVGA